MEPMELYMEGHDDDDMEGVRARRGRRRRRPKSRAGRVRRKLMRGARAGGASVAKLGKYNLGFPVQTFSPAAGGPLTAESNPQKPFKPMRLVVVVTRTPITTGGLITINPGTAVGVDPVLVSNDAIPAEAFSPEASNGMDNIAWPEASKGLDVTIVYGITVVPGVGEQVDVGTALFGPTAT